MNGPIPADDRGVSEAIGTIFSVVVMVLFAIAIVPGLTVVSDAATLAQSQQMEFEAQRLAGELQAVDRMIRSSDATGGAIGRHVTLSSHIGNQRYSIEVDYYDDMKGGYVYFRVNGGDLSTRVQYASRTPVANTTIPQGGNVYVVRRGGAANVTVNYEG